MFTEITFNFETRKAIQAAVMELSRKCLWRLSQHGEVYCIHHLHLDSCGRLGHDFVAQLNKQKSGYSSAKNSASFWEAAQRP